MTFEEFHQLTAHLSSRDRQAAFDELPRWQQDECWDALERRLAAERDALWWLRRRAA